MPVYKVWLETSTSGLTMAHVPELPGCAIRGESKREALESLPPVIWAYLVSTESSAEGVPELEQIELEVVEEIGEDGPFNPGDSAALFSGDHTPLSRPELSRWLQLAERNRAELMELVAPLPDELLDWKPDAESFSIGRILRHLGNAEQWYVSRLVAQGSLPSEWDSDEDLGLLDFLAMVRRTSAARLKQLSDSELSQVTRRAEWTRHPEEQWTARKALRRLLEHEREHTGQIREMLHLWRTRKLAEMAAARAEFAWLLLGADEVTLNQRTVFDNYTVKDLLAHIAAWDQLHAEQLGCIAENRPGDMAQPEKDTNVRFQRMHAEWNLERALDAFQRARRNFLAQVERLSDPLLHRAVTTPWGKTLSARALLERRAQHDLAHAADLGPWRRELESDYAHGPLPVLLCALQASRAEIHALIQLIPESERDRRPLTADGWTLKDIIGHIADWEAYLVTTLQTGSFPEPVAEAEVQRWNEMHWHARRHQSWDAVWTFCESVRTALIGSLHALTEDGLSMPLVDETGSVGPTYRIVVEWLLHEREHAVWLRSTLMSDLDERLRHEPLLQ